MMWKIHSNRDQCFAAFVYLAILFPTTGCGEQEDIGNAQVALSQVPLDVQCIRLTATGTRTVVRTYDVNPGFPVVLDISGLPIGQVTFIGEAFPTPCSGVNDLSVASWIAEPVTATVSAGSPPTVALVLRPNGRAAVCLDFEGDTAMLPRLTSITLDPEDSTGTTTNAPGAWSTNLADPLSQILVLSKGQRMNQGAGTGWAGEISVPLSPGVNTFTLIGNGIFPGNLYYGAVLFFDSVATPPQIAVFNSNGSTGAFSVQPKGTTIMGGANGGLFFDVAPGNSSYPYEYKVGDVIVSRGKIEVLSFSINSTSTSIDMMSAYVIAPNGQPDTVGNLTLKVTPVCP
ncbi:MAG: hypothetical protein V2A56_05750 [bacterium]